LGIKEFKRGKKKAKDHIDEAAKRINQKFPASIKTTESVRMKTQRTLKNLDPWVSTKKKKKNSQR